MKSRVKHIGSQTDHRIMSEILTRSAPHRCASPCHAISTVMVSHDYFPLGLDNILAHRHLIFPALFYQRDSFDQLNMFKLPNNNININI